ncbi:hypothetical protein [Burkholderia pseudomultivorans]|uniref:hypothetical protein n=1 Tax=Burkholderia pseudomultivorans TaxID=1207504 RepID=UPI0012D88B4D|nr:hypothetical protein [Burkholderia pseudomultivorans]
MMTNDHERRADGDFRRLTRSIQANMTGCARESGTIFPLIAERCLLPAGPERATGGQRIQRSQSISSEQAHAMPTQRKNTCSAILKDRPQDGSTGMTVSPIDVRP